METVLHALKAMGKANSVELAARLDISREEVLNELWELKKNGVVDKTGHTWFLAVEGEAGVAEGQALQPEAPDVVTVLRWRMSSTTPPRISVRTDAASACAGVRCAAWWLILAVSFPLTNFRSKSNDTDRISDSGACPAVCACGVVRLRDKHAGGGTVYPLCEYLCRAGGVFSYRTGRLAAGRDAGGDCGTGPQSSRWTALAERG